MVGAGARAVAGGPGAGAKDGVDDGGASLAGCGLGAEKYTFFGGSVGGTRIGITHETSG